MNNITIEFGSLGAENRNYDQKMFYLELVFNFYSRYLFSQNTSLMQCN